MERRCCSFIAFTVIPNSEENPILLELTGNEEVKTFLWKDMQGKINRVAQVDF